jgi:hypothetical protein
MACPWNLGIGDPDQETGTIVCRCVTCDRYADLPCERDFQTGTLIVSVMACVAKGGPLATREKA